jgi:hypothetical protein
MDESYFIPEQKMESEYGALERSGGRRFMSTLIEDTGGELSNAQKRIERELLSPEEKFSRAVGAILSDWDNNDIYKIGDRDGDILLNKIQSMSKIKYINPVGYILGFIASRGGQKLDPKTDKVNYVIKNILPNIQDEGVAPPDVIRYARFWYNLI